MLATYITRSEASAGQGVGTVGRGAEGRARVQLKTAAAADSPTRTCLPEPLFACCNDLPAPPLLLAR